MSINGFMDQNGQIQRYNFESLDNKPTKVSDFDNDSGFLTENDISYIRDTAVNGNLNQKIKVNPFVIRTSSDLYGTIRVNRTTATINQNGSITFTPVTSTNITDGFWIEIANDTISSHKVYISVKGLSTTRPDFVKWRIFVSQSGERYLTDTIEFTESNYSTVVNFTTLEAINIQISFLEVGSQSNSSNTSFTIRSMQVIDLTEMFGAGLEPSLEEFEAVYGSGMPYSYRIPEIVEDLKDEKVLALSVINSIINGNNDQSIIYRGHLTDADDLHNLEHPGMYFVATDYGVPDNFPYENPGSAIVLVIKPSTTNNHWGETHYVMGTTSLWIERCTNGGTNWTGWKRITDDSSFISDKGTLSSSNDLHNIEYPGIYFIDYRSLPENFPYAATGSTRILVNKSSSPTNHLGESHFILGPSGSLWYEKCANSAGTNWSEWKKLSDADEVINSSHGFVGSYDGAFTDSSQSIDTNITLKANTTYCIKFYLPRKKAFNVYRNGNSTNYKRVRPYYDEIYFTNDSVSGNLKLWNGDVSVYDDISLKVFEVDSTEKKSEEIPRIYRINKNVPEIADYTSVTECFLALKDDPNPKIIEIWEGDYDIYQEYVNANVPVYTGTNPSMDFVDYCVYIPPNSHVIGKGLVRLKWMPDPSNNNITPNQCKCVSPINIMGSMTLENVEIYCKNGRYCIHNDTVGLPEFAGVEWRFINIKCYKYINDSINGVSYGFSSALGFGMNRSMHHYYENCEFHNENTNSSGWAFYGHTNVQYDGSSIPEAQSGEIVLNHCIMDTSSDVCVRLGNSSSVRRKINTKFNNCFFSGPIRIVDESSGGGTKPNNFDLTLCDCNDIDIYIADPTNIYAPKKYPEIDKYDVYPSSVVDDEIAYFTDGANDVPVIGLSTTIDPIISGSGDASPSNVYKIGGFNSIKLKKTTRNLWPGAIGRTVNNITFTTNADGSVIITSSAPASDTAFSSAVTVDLKPGIYRKNPQNDGVYVYVQYVSLEGNWITIPGGGPSSSQFTITEEIANKYRIIVRIAVQSGTFFNSPYFFYPYFYKVDNATTNWEAPNKSEIEVAIPSIPLNDSISGFVHSGNVNLINGRVYADKVKVSLGDLSWERKTNQKGTYYYVGSGIENAMQRPVTSQDLPDIICSHYKTVLSSTIYSHNGNSGTSTMPTTNPSDFISIEANDDMSGIGRIIIMDSAYMYGSTSGEQFKTILQNNSVEAACSLQNPVEFDGTSVNFKTLYGKNSIWTDCGKVYIAYRSDIALYTKKIAEPKIVRFSVNGNSVTASISSEEIAEALASNYDVIGEIYTGESSEMTWNPNTRLKLTIYTASSSKLYSAKFQNVYMVQPGTLSVVSIDYTDDIHGGYWSYSTQNYELTEAT